LELGSDVPFFLFSKPALAKGRGEILMPLDIKIKGVILIINPNIHISTKDAFENITPHKRSIKLAELADNSSFNCEKASGKLTNDFENYIFSIHPEIEMIKESMLAKGAKIALMSGTGSTVFGVFNSLHSAMECSADFDSEFLKLTSYDHG
jgi:4-diphosphocytidyl-2-C-methyl-D-erythritol kinase